MACYINNVYKRSWWWGGICARIGGSNKGRFSFTYWQNLVDIQPSARSPSPILFNTHLHTTTLGRKTTGNVFAPCWTFSLQSWSVGAMVTLVAHLLWQLMGVEDAGHRHLELVFFFLGLAQSCLSLLQEEVWRVLTSKLLQDHTSGRFGNLDSFGCVVLLKPHSFNTSAFKFNSSTLKFYSSTKKQVSAVFSLMNNIFVLKFTWA